jgi:hypothetical protein
MLHLFVYGEKQNLNPLPELLDYLLLATSRLLRLSSGH